MKVQESWGASKISAAFKRAFRLVRQSRENPQTRLFGAPNRNTMASFNPTQIFDDGTTEEKGENARLSAFVGAIAVGDLGSLF